MKMMLALAVLVAVAAPALAKDRDDVPLSPIGLPFGLPFGPETPRHLPPDHPLYRAVVLAGTDALPDKLGPAKRERFVAALGDTLGQLDLLATDPAKARFRLTPVWVDIDAPMRISFASHATAKLAWRLTRVDDGRTIFYRDIATSAESRGGSGYERRIGVERVALMTNIASAVACLDKAAYGRAPADCALTPAFTYHAPTPTVTMIYIRR